MPSNQLVFQPVSTFREDKPGSGAGSAGGRGLRISALDKALRQPPAASSRHAGQYHIGEMTNSQRGGKRARLVASATELLHRQGVHRTTLADIAASADVPLGNVYYYYKTRDELVDAVIEQWKASLCEQLSQLDERRTPQARLKGLAELWTAQAETIAADGCPLGGLSYELNKGHDALAEHARELLGTVLDWAEAQFRALRLRDARGLAVHLISGIQGATLLANTFGDAPLLRAEVRRLERWIDELAEAGPSIKPRRPAG